MVVVIMLRPSNNLVHVMPLFPYRLSCRELATLALTHNNAHPSKVTSLLSVTQ